jgi:hypothetical protein
MVGAVGCWILRVKFCVVEPPEFVAVTENANEPVVADVPVNSAFPAPPKKVIPLGREPD